jgi:hypothetical protein
MMLSEATLEGIRCFLSLNKWRCLEYWGKAAGKHREFLSKITKKLFKQIGVYDKAIMQKQKMYVCIDARFSNEIVQTCFRISLKSLKHYSQSGYYD